MHSHMSTLNKKKQVGSKQTKLNVSTRTGNTVLHLKKSSCQSEVATKSKNTPQLPFNGPSTSIILLCKNQNKKDTEGFHIHSHIVLLGAFSWEYEL